MAALEDLVNVDYIRSLVTSGETHKSISRRLQQVVPGCRGISERGVRRFCRKHGLQRMDDAELDGVVTSFVARYGHHYGR